MPDPHCTYLCPIRLPAADEGRAKAFDQYWEFLQKQGCEVLVIDGSPPDIFNLHARKWRHCRHLKVDGRFTFLNGKVNGIMTGIKEATHEAVILADDDIHFIAADIRRMVEELKNVDVVRPQNYFQPLPWWSCIDTARILINRAVLPTGDYPGTFGLRKSVFEAAGAFDGDVLFDNEELVKHLAHAGARIKYASDFFILRRPPTLEKWLEQRPRQAYEDFVMKKKTALFLSLLPLHLLMGARGKRKALRASLLLISSVGIGLALWGRKGKASRYFPARMVFYAPLWVLERAVSIYAALYWRFRKGGYPFGDVLIRKGTGEAWKRV